jgi:hypothetical protein
MLMRNVFTILEKHIQKTRRYRTHEALIIEEWLRLRKFKSIYCQP